MTNSRTPILVHAWMSATEMIAACGLTLRRASTWTYSVYGPGKERLFTGTMPSIKTWLRREGYVA